MTIQPSGKVISVMEGKTLNLICEVSDKSRVESVRWTRQSKGVVLRQEYKLSLEKIKIEDTDIYECIVKAEKGESKASVSVVVQSKYILWHVSRTVARTLFAGGGGVLTDEFFFKSNLNYSITPLGKT